MGTVEYSLFGLDDLLYQAINWLFTEYLIDFRSPLVHYMCMCMHMHACMVAYWVYSNAYYPQANMSN